MKITPIASPAAIPPQGTPEHVRTARAVEAFTKGQSSYDKAPLTPVEEPKTLENHSIDPNNISPEEMSAIKPQTDKDVSIEEPVKEEQPEEKEVDPALSRQFAQLARQQKALRAKQQQQEQSFAAREKALAEREAAYTKPQDLTNYISKDELKRNTLQKLAEANISYDELTQQILNTTAPDPRTEALLSKQEARIAQLEAKLEESAKSYTESQQQAYQAAVKQIRADAENLVKMDPNFETIAATKSVSDVVDLITKTYERDNILLSVEEAAKEVEDYLVDEAMKLSRIGKIKSRLEQSAQKASTKQQTQAPKQQTQPATMKTLTNAASNSRPLTARERAVLAFKGELKS